MMAKKVMIMMMAGMMSVMSLTACGGNGQAKSLVDAQSKVISSVVADHSESTADASGSTALADPSSVLAGGDDRHRSRLHGNSIRHWQMQRKLPGLR